MHAAVAVPKPGDRRTGRYLWGHHGWHVPHWLDVPDGRGVLVLRAAPWQGGRGGHPGADRLCPDVGCNGDGNISIKKLVKCMSAQGRLKPQGQSAQPESPKSHPMGSKQPPGQRQLPQDRQGNPAILPAGLGWSDFSAEGRRASKGTYTSLSLLQKCPSASAARGCVQHQGGGCKSKCPWLTLSLFLQ